MKNTSVLKIYGWLIILQGLLLYFLFAHEGVSFPGRMIGLGVFGYFMMPLIFILFFSYIGIGLIGFKKKVVRKCYLLSILGCLLGILEIIDTQSWYGYALIVFYSSLIYFLKQPKVKEQFK